ncbi:Protein HIR2, partial [Clarias magur]
MFIIIIIIIIVHDLVTPDLSTASALLSQHTCLFPHVQRAVLNINQRPVRPPLSRRSLSHPPEQTARRLQTRLRSEPRASELTSRQDLLSRNTGDKNLMTQRGHFVICTLTDPPIIPCDHDVIGVRINPRDNAVNVAL